MIYIEHIPGCRLGNILFQVAAALSLDANVTFCSKDDATLEYIQQFQNNILKLITIQKELPSLKQLKCYEEPFENCYIYYPIPYQQGEDIVIKGFFQSYKYLCREVVIKSFSISEDIRKLIGNNFPYLYNGLWTSIHVRRGDYLNKKNRYIHPICSIGYYKKAISQFPLEMNYLIISDDIVWCKSHFKGKKFYFAENTTAIIYLYLPSFCHNNIISNSSYGWWGAYLNQHENKIVIAPKIWIGYVAELKVKDLLPQKIIIINNQHSLHSMLDYILSHWNRIRYNDKYSFIRKILFPFVRLKQFLHTKQH